MARVDPDSKHSELHTNKTVTNARIRNEEKVEVHDSMVDSKVLLLNSVRKKKTVVNLHNKFAFLKLSLQITSRILVSTTDVELESVAHVTWMGKVCLFCESCW